MEKSECSGIAVFLIGIALLLTTFVDAYLFLPVHNLKEHARWVGSWQNQRRIFGRMFQAFRLTRHNSHRSVKSRSNDNAGGKSRKGEIAMIRGWAKRLGSSKAVSPAVSAVIMTGTVVALISVALVFANNLLSVRMAESEFNSAMQVMQTVGLQIDDVAWVIGRTETVRYSSRYGDVAFESALNYTIYINTTTQSNQILYTTTTGILCFNMPVSQYSVGNNYYELIYPSVGEGLLLNGASAPVARVFAVEMLPMGSDSFLRVVVAPTIRMLNSPIGDTNYVRLYLPVLSEGNATKRYQSITLTGESVFKLGESVTGIKVEVDFPLPGFDNSFFHFSKTVETISLTGKTVVELFVGEVDVALGVHP